jgi:hypothetical protein
MTEISRSMYVGNRIYDSFVVLFASSFGNPNSAIYHGEDVYESTLASRKRSDGREMAAHLEVTTWRGFHSSGDLYFA